MGETRNIAIVGIGPRGLSALESLLEALAKEQVLVDIHFFLFEESPYPGSGPVYAPDQRDSNWINIPERNIDIRPRLSIRTENLNIPAFPSFYEWSNVIQKESEPDTYPPRSRVGRYLAQRFQSLYTVLEEAGVASLIPEHVEIADPVNHHIVIRTTQETYNVDALLLTPGHQPTTPADELVEWKEHAKKHRDIAFFDDPYPVEAILKSGFITEGNTIAIRGFGLSMIDVARAIATSVGTFTLTNTQTRRCTYHTGLQLREFLLPFSLDGLPMAPKPINQEIDMLFKPSSAARKTFEQHISDTDRQANATDEGFIIEAIIPCIIEVYSPLQKDPALSEETIGDLSRAWLSNSRPSHPSIVPVSQDTETTMRDFVAMATGETTSSLDYCIGQVWRHCQDILHNALSHSRCSDEVMAKVIDLDERMKRYSYGPPVESVQQLLALIEAGVMSLAVLNDPDITTPSNGWQLQVNNTSRIANVMIDSVLDPPELKSVKSTMIRQLLRHEILKPVHNDLGVKTDKYAYLVSEDAEYATSIALIGRLATGTVIGADSLPLCFGEEIKAWARSTAERHKAWLRAGR